MMPYEGSFQTGVNSEKYKENYDRIFRKEHPGVNTAEDKEKDEIPSKS